MNNFKTLAKEYIDLFRQKNLIGLKNLFDQNIKLIDWENEIEGVNDLIKLNRKLFKEFEYIDINILNIVSEKNLVFIELRIELDKKVFLKVVDIIKFSKDNKIISIKAYKAQNKTYKLYGLVFDLLEDRIMY